LISTRDEKGAAMTNSEFYILVSCIAKAATTWTHDGTVTKLARARGNDEISPDTPQRFCEEIRELLSDIDELATPRQS
jgi:hypothetical protein